ncbi:hypothetical protein HYW74_03855 [Candidatus Pacearchaeota archaeon]|nr:hypothetical protein [Candidatus Pacearchaeota archaeon]
MDNIKQNSLSTVFIGICFLTGLTGVTLGQIHANKKIIEQINDQRYNSIDEMARDMNRPVNFKDFSRLVGGDYIAGDIFGMLDLMPGSGYDASGVKSRLYEYVDEKYPGIHGETIKYVLENYELIPATSAP